MDQPTHHHENESTIAALQAGLAQNPDDAPAAFQLGSLLYAAGRHDQAITWWEKSAKLDGQNPQVWRNLGRAYFNILHDHLAAEGAYKRAFRLSLTPPTEDQELDGTYIPTGGDAQILYERDQLAKLLQQPPLTRLEELATYPHLVPQRDDLTVEYCALLNLTGEHAQALAILQGRTFHPGSGGLVLAQWARAHIALGRQELWRADGSRPAALAHCRAVLQPPASLGETWPPAYNHSEAHYWAGLAAQAIPDRDSAAHHLHAAAAGAPDFRTPGATAATFWSAMAMQELGQRDQARAVFEELLANAHTTPANTPTPPPLFDDGPTGLRRARDLHATLLEALARYGLNSEQGAGGGDRRTARRLLGDILTQDPSHLLAADLLIALDWNI